MLSRLYTQYQSEKNLISKESCLGVDRRSGIRKPRDAYIYTWEFRRLARSGGPTTVALHEV